MMSSETSTDAQPVASESGGRLARNRDAGFQPWQLFTLAGLISASAIAFRAGSQPSSVRVALIVTVFGAAVMGIAALRALLPLTGRRDVIDAPIIGGRTRAALEREKMLALRSIKELEFDRAMGKVSDKDFDDMSARLRARAARIMRDLDAKSDYRDDIEREIARRVGQPSETPATPTTRQPPATGCHQCGTVNDPDARFCKSCGQRMEVA